ncbi:MAG: 3-dehydroquinate synthase [Clostridia bacterium]|nr:3-dehydroquinate synthase [Clostridia bacterium]
MKTITVNASKKYNVIISSDLGGLTAFLAPLIKGDKVAVITDDTVSKLYASEVISALKGYEVSVLTVKSGEDSKNATNFIYLANELARLGFSRTSTVIALGGGVIGDLAGLVSATFMRGITLIQIPTTLLSMVDSSVGGKTAIDLDAGKNLLGVFYQPNGVYVSLSFLKTLPQREIVCGLGEITKYAFIDGRITPQDISEKNYEKLIEKSLEIKRDIVERDEKESGDRMLLNFGHTVGHAIEKLYNYTLSHGECVIMGMYSALNVSKALGYLSENGYNSGVKLLNETGVMPCNDFSKDQILSVMKKDKKGDGDSVNFVVTTGFGSSKPVKIKYEKLIEII